MGSQSKRLCPSKYQKRTSRLPFRAIPPWRQRGRCATARARSQGAAANLAPETTSSTKLWEGCQLIATSSWDPGQISSTRVLQPEISSSEETLNTGTVASQHTLENKWPGLGKSVGHMAHLGQCSYHSPRCPSGLDLGRAQSNSPSGPAPLQSSWDPEQLRPGECVKHRGHLGQCPGGAPWILSSVGPENTHHLGPWQTQCGPSTARTPHTCQWYLFALSLLPHSKTE